MKHMKFQYVADARVDHQYYHFGIVPENAKLVLRLVASLPSLSLSLSFPFSPLSTYITYQLQ
jgi:hypothetical protein